MGAEGQVMRAEENQNPYFTITWNEEKENTCAYKIPFISIYFLLILAKHA